MYDILIEEISDKQIKNRIKYGDCGDMYIETISCEKIDRKVKFMYSETDYLKCEICMEDELPEEQKILKKLKMICEGKMFWEELLVEGRFEL